VIKTDKFQRVEVATQEELRAWLLSHHGQSESVWLVTYKKHIRAKYISTSEILDELIGFGWIDGIRRKIDADKTMQLISPRKAQHWAETYKTRAERLQKEGRMHQAGLKSLEAAKQNGKWTFMADVDALRIPDDLNNALNNHPTAAETLNAFPPSYRRNILRWLRLARTSATRQKRIQQIAEFSHQNRRIPRM
jgi:uncharacterized protein YdeI (YjbR/CyaY-like superfamily)